MAKGTSVPSRTMAVSLADQAEGTKPSRRASGTGESQAANQCRAAHRELTEAGQADEGGRVREACHQLRLKLVRIRRRAASSHTASGDRADDLQDNDEKQHDDRQHKHRPDARRGWDAGMAPLERRHGLHERGSPKGWSERVTSSE